MIKKATSILVAVLLPPCILLGQNMSKVIATQEFNWYGLDFTRAKMIGYEGFTDPDVLVNKDIHYEWNKKIRKEFKKYDPGKPMGKIAIPYMNVCNNRNKKVTEEGLIINKSYYLLPKDIKNIINEYPKKKDGDMGLVFIVESFNKTDEKGYIWVTFFDERTGQVFVTERLEGNARGFGLVNYWLGAVYHVTKKLKKLYKFWVKNYGS